MDNDELHALYVDRLNQVPISSFDDIRREAMRLLKSLFDTEARNRLYDELDHGVIVIDREELLWQYLWSFGAMHKNKMYRALEKLPGLDNILREGYSIIDWGCGQGLATVCLLDFIRAMGINTLPDRTIFIDPSMLAIENARLHVGLLGIDDPKLVIKLLDDVRESEIETETPVTIHLFSNILDIPTIDLIKLAQLIGNNAIGTHYFVCVSPKISNGRSERLDLFRQYFINAVDIASHESSINYVTTLAEEEYEKGVIGKYAIKLIVFKYIEGKSSVIQVDYYPPVQFFAAYQLDSLWKIDGDHMEREAPRWTSFELATPFEIAGHVYDDVHPVFAILNNIATRGLPTRCSPFVEQAFEDYGECAFPDNLGAIRFGGPRFDDSLARVAQVWTPIGIARVQKAILEALICEKLPLDAKCWRVLVRERDVPCAALAFADLAEAFTHLVALTRDYRELSWPEVDLTVIGTEAYAASPLHLDADVRCEPDDWVRSRRYDLVIDISTKGAITDDGLTFSEFRARNNCYFVIGSSEQVRSRRHIYTSDTITYASLGINDRTGIFVNDDEQIRHLTYFLNLLFRKRQFREGQIPILNRALQNKNVIGLLPTGGGKSLTYQLAAMLQPGVTIVVDPLRSLMQDQYQGLIETGIDACTYINSTKATAARREAERRLESSELQFVFLSPERLCIYEFRERLQMMHETNVYFAYGVIDEVHCVSEWGHDFRFSYLHLGRNLYQYVHTKDEDSPLTLFGLTATASFDVLSDVERELSGAGAYELDADTIVRYENTDRLELQYKVVTVPVEFRESFYPKIGNAPKARYVTSWDANTCKSDYLRSHILEFPVEVEELQSEESIDRIRRRFAVRQNADITLSSRLFLRPQPGPRDHVSPPGT